MPGFYPEDEYDLAGFTVGVVEKPRCITGQQAEAGDVVIGLASSGLQSSGFSLVRKIFFQDHGHKVTDHFDELGRTLGEELLEPTLVYVKPILSLINAVEITGIANISGGGMPENLPRSMPDNLDAVIRKGSWPIQPIFTIVQRLGESMKQRCTALIGISMTVTVKAGSGLLPCEAGRVGLAYIIGELVPAREVVFA